MNLLKRFPLHGSAFALALTAVALSISLLARPFLEPQTFLPFVVAVWLSAWFSGRTAGLLAMAASTAAIVYFFLWPGLGSPETFWWRAAARLLGFVATASILTWVTAAWRQSRSVLVSTLASIGDAVLATDAQGRVTFMNAAAETLTGWRGGEARGKPAGEIVKLIDAKTREPIGHPLHRALRDRAAVESGHLLLVTRSGAEVAVEPTAAPVRDDSGPAPGGILVIRDIGKRLQLEEAATHAQRMDAVSRLAGGVAGDFNNVLTVIGGYAELLRAEAPPSSPTQRYASEIIYAGERAAALTRHLLAFSGGASGQPRSTDLNAVLAAMEPMLRRLLGQGIELLLLASPGLGRVQADPAQIEQVIVNLATNSRDAMPNGGKLVLETANADLEDIGGDNPGVKPGPYVMLAVSDTGMGMDAQTRSRVFEPFFTTKGPGQGSGLGLATVYGAIKQMEGHVTVYSQPECGTIFEIYLPRAANAAGDGRKLSPKGSETILLVDDEEGVRKLMRAVLQSNGYEVIEAANGPAALEAHEKNGHKIDMLLTDVVMPQMTGFELGKQLESRAPALKILYFSGYRDNGLGIDGQAPRAFLHKPFTPDVLLSKVREVLDAGNV